MKQVSEVIKYEGIIKVHGIHTLNNPHYTLHDNRKMIHKVGSILATEKQYILKCSHNSCTYVTIDILLIINNN